MKSYDKGGDLLAGPYQVPLREGEYSRSIGSFGESQLVEIAKQGHFGINKLRLSVTYDLPPNPEEFDPNRANINPGRIDIPMTFIDIRFLLKYSGVEYLLKYTRLYTGIGLFLKYGRKGKKRLASFLDERGELEKKLEHRQRESVHVYIRGGN